MNKKLSVLLITAGFVIGLFFGIALLLTGVIQMPHSDSPASVAASSATPTDQSSYYVLYDLRGTTFENGTAWTTLTFYGLASSQEEAQRMIGAASEKHRVIADGPFLVNKGWICGQDSVENHGPGYVENFHFREAGPDAPNN